jgi:hypothetical protein
MAGWVKVALDRELDNRYSGTGIHQHHGYPCTVIETTACISIAGESCIFHKTGNVAGELWCSRCRIGNPVELPGKPREIMDCRGFCHRIYCRPWRVPVSRNAENSGNAREPETEAGKEFTGRYSPFKGQGWCTMRDKKSGKRIRSHGWYSFLGAKKEADAYNGISAFAGD